MIREKKPAEPQPDAQVQSEYIHIEAAARRGLFNWREKPHNRKWWSKIDGTPIPNDLIVNITEEIVQSLKSGAIASYEQGVLDEHKSHIDYENELYATLVDPVAEGPIKEAEMRKQLLESARWYRQHAHDLETQLNNARAAEQRATRVALEAHMPSPTFNKCACGWEMFQHTAHPNYVQWQEHIRALSAPAQTPSEEERT